MFALNDLLALLDHWPKWKKIQNMPDQFDGLAQRVSELEKRLARCPGEGCPSCGELEFRVTSSKPHPSMGEVGALLREMKCRKCGFSEPQTFMPEYPFPLCVKYILPELFNLR